MAINNGKIPGEWSILAFESQVTHQTVCFCRGSGFLYSKKPSTMGNVSTTSCFPISKHGFIESVRIRLFYFFSWPKIRLFKNIIFLTDVHSPRFKSLGNGGIIPTCENPKKTETLNYIYSEKRTRRSGPSANLESDSTASPRRPLLRYIIAKKRKGKSVLAFQFLERSHATTLPLQKIGRSHSPTIREK